MIKGSFCRGFLKELRKCRRQPYHVEDVRYILSLPSVRAIPGTGGLSECCDVVDPSVNVPVDPLELAPVCKCDFLKAIRTKPGDRLLLEPAQQLSTIFWMLRRLKGVQTRSVGSGAAHGVVRTLCEKTARDAFPASLMFIQSGMEIDVEALTRECLRDSSSGGKWKTVCRDLLPTSLTVVADGVRAEISLALYEPLFVPSPTATEDDGIPFRECRPRFKLGIKLSGPANTMVTVVNTHFFVACPSDGTLFEHSSLMDPSDISKIHQAEQPDLHRHTSSTGGHQSRQLSGGPRSLGSGVKLSAIHSDLRVFFLTLPKGCSWGMLKGLLYVKVHNPKDKSSLCNAPIQTIPFGVLKLIDE